MINLSDDKFMFFSYYIADFDDETHETTLKRSDYEYEDYYDSSVIMSYRQFCNYIENNNYEILKLYFQDDAFRQYFEERSAGIYDGDDMMITSRLYEVMLYSTTITLNIIDRQSLNHVKLKFGECYKDDLIDDSYEVIISYIHQACEEAGMSYMEYMQCLIQTK